MSNSTGYDEKGPRAIFISPETAGATLGIPRTKVYELLRMGELQSVKYGKRRLISRQSVEDWAARKLEETG